MKKSEQSSVAADGMQHSWREGDWHGDTAQPSKPLQLLLNEPYLLKVLTQCSTYGTFITNLSDGSLQKLERTDYMLIHAVP